MGEAMSEGGVFAHAKARALLEVVRLAFEGGIAFEPDLADSSCATVPSDDGREGPATTSSPRHRAKVGKDHSQPAHAPHRPASTGSSSRLVPGGPCMWCGVTVTPQWRRPRGTNKLLCNACGIFFTRYGRLPEKSHHLHQAASQAPSASTPLDVHGQAMAAASHLAGGVNQVLGQDQPDGDAGLDADLSFQEPGAHASQALQPAPQPAPAPRSEQLQLRPHQQQQQQQQPTVSTSSMAGINAHHKRKDAPQPEADLLRCMEDYSSSTFGDTAASPAPALATAAASAHAPPGSGPSQGALLGPLGNPMQQPTAAPRGATADAAMDIEGAVPAAAAAAAPDRPAASMLTVTPLDLGLQHLSQIQQLGLLGPHLAGLGALAPSSLCLQGPAAAAASAAAATIAARALAPSGLGQHGLSLGLGFGSSAAAAMALGLPAEFLMGRPFAVPVGLLPPGGTAGLLDPAAAAAAMAAAAAQPAPQRPLYARPPKRQERLPAGESDDSNVSTDSHAATHGDAGGTSHDEDEGGTTTTITAGTTASTAVTARSGMSCSPPGAQAVSAYLPVPLTAQVPLLQAVAQGDGSTLPVPPTLPVAIGTAPEALAAGAPACAVLTPTASAGGNLAPQQPHQLPAAPPQHQQVILLQARRSKGPRSRAASGSATPSSSAQS